MRISGFLVYECVYARAAALRLHAVLLCLFYFVSSINDEAPGGRERGTQRSPRGNALAAGHRPLSITHLPQP